MSTPKPLRQSAGRRSILLLTLCVSLALHPASAAQGPQPPAALPDSASPAQLESMEARLRAAIQLTPDVASFHASLADVLMAQGRPGEARTAIAEAVRLEPATVAYRAALGQAHMTQQEWTEAETNFAYAITLSPQDAGLHAALGEALLQQDRLAEAEESFDRASTMAPDDTLLALRRDEIRARREEVEPGLAVASGTLGLLVRFFRYAAATLLTLAGVLIALPVLASIILVVFVIPLSLLKRRRAD